MTYCTSDKNHSGMMNLVKSRECKSGDEPDLSELGRDRGSIEAGVCLSELHYAQAFCFTQHLLPSSFFICFFD
jgi:hypothetical protein